MMFLLQKWRVEIHFKEQVQSKEDWKLSVDSAFSMQDGKFPDQLRISIICDLADTPSDN